MAWTRVTRCVTVAAALAFAFCAPGPASAQKSTITFGSTNATSSNYALAVAMSKAIKKELPNANVSMIETGASVDNVRRMTKGEIDFGLVMADTSIQALAGTGPFQGKAVEDLAVLYVHDIVTLQLVVRADSGVATLKDLQGKKFSAGIRGSGAELLTRQMFQLHGHRAAVVAGLHPGRHRGHAEPAARRLLQIRRRHGPRRHAARADGIDADALPVLRHRAAGAAILAKIKGVDFAEIPANTIPGQGAVTTPDRVRHLLGAGGDHGRRHRVLHRQGHQREQAVSRRRIPASQGHGLQGAGPEEPRRSG